VVVPHGQDVIPRGFRGGVSWSGRNSNKVAWWCLMVKT